MRSLLDQTHLGQAVEPGTPYSLQRTGGDPTVVFVRTINGEAASERFANVQVPHVRHKSAPDGEPRKEHPGDSEEVSSTVYVAQLGKPDGKACTSAT